MKRPSAASLKRVTAENLARLGAERLAEILLEVADTRVELKRRLRMELAAEQGAEHLLPEIDRRLALLASSRGAVTWRQRPAFVRDLDGVRGLIAGKLAELDPAAAQDRIGVFLRLADRVQRRVRDKEGAVEAVFRRAAGDAVRLLATGEDGGARLAGAITEQPGAWSRWAHEALGAEDMEIARAALTFLPASTAVSWTPVLRRLADVAGDVDVYGATFTAQALQTPGVAAAVATRLLQAERLEAARQVLEGAIRPGLVRTGRGGEAQVDFDWESAWIDYLEAAGRGDEAQAARWASFERTLSAARAKAYVQRLPDFEDVEAEQRIFEAAAAYADAELALALLVDWPAHGEAARFVEARGEALRPEPAQAEAWARKLRRRYPAAAERLLRRGAATAFQRREYATSKRLTEEADALGGCA